MTTRLIAAFIALCAFVLAVLIVPLGIAHQRSERDDLTRRIERDAVAVASIASDALRTNGTHPAALDSYLTAYTKRTDARVVVVDAAAIELVDTDAPASARGTPSRSFASRPEIAAALKGRVVSGERRSKTLGYSLLYVAVPVTAGGASLGAVRVSYPTSELVARTHSYWLGLGAIACTVLAIASLVAALLARWLARPIERLTGAAGRMGEGDLSVRADTTAGPPEVRQLATRFNDSVTTIERLVMAQREFVADASHQLRTPLQALRLRLENAQSDIDHNREGRGGEILEPAIDEVDRLAALVTALLVLERADAADPGALEEVDVAEVIARRADAWTRLGNLRNVVVVVDAPEPLIALARDVHVEQVLDNLVDNAIGVSPAGAQVEIVARQIDGVVHAHVIDAGPGMSDEQIEHAFRRFTSGGDRSSSSGQGGFGIGLAIVRRLSELDGGSVTLHRNPRGGIDATVSYRAPTAGASLDEPA